MAAISCDPNTLESNARCFACIPLGFKPAVNVSLLNSISGVNGSLQSLLDNSVGFDKFGQYWALSAEVYLLAQIAGLGTLIPGQLANQARLFFGRDGDLEDITTYLYASQAAGSLDPNTLMAAAKSYTRLFGIEWRAALYLTCQWALSKSAVSSCDPSALLTASRCYGNCLSTYSLRMVRTYLLCQIVSGAGGGGGGGQNCGTQTNIVTISGAGTAAANGQYVTTDFNTWTNPVSGYFIVTPAGPNVAQLYRFDVTSMYVLPAGQLFPCGNWTVANGVGPAPTGVYTAPGVVATGWAARVVTNGGAMPSQNSINAVAVFDILNKAAGIDSLIISDIPCAPDSLIAAITPIYKVAGNDPWTNHAFVLGDLSVNGLTGNGVTKYLDSGVAPSTAYASANDGGMSIYAFTYPLGNTVPIGTAPNGNQELWMQFFGGSTFWACYDDASKISGVNNSFPGFYSGNRTGAAATALYFASSLHAFTTIASAATGPVAGLPIATVGGFAASDATFFSSATLSYLCVHHGLTLLQSNSLFNNVQAMRTVFGGGFI